MLPHGASLNSFGIIVAAQFIHKIFQLAWQNREDFYIIYIFSFIVWYKNACYLEKSLHLKELFLL